MGAARREPLDFVIERPLCTPAAAGSRSADTERRTIPAVAEPLVSFNAPGSFEADQYRALRYAVERRQREAGLKVLGVSSPGPGDGKSVTLLNLAGALGQARRSRVLVVDADLRRPSIAQYLGLPPRHARGLADAIVEDGVDWTDAIVPLDEFNLSVLPSDAVRESPYELLSAPRFERILAEARRQFDFVLIDTPPLLPFPDCRVLTRLVDGFLLVVAAHRTPRRMVAEALRLLDPAQIAGVVFNGEDSRRSSYGAYAYYGYHGTQGG